MLLLCCYEVILTYVVCIEILQYLLLQISQQIVGKTAVDEHRNMDIKNLVE